jgi:hypothetical protein
MSARRVYHHVLGHGTEVTWLRCQCASCYARRFYTGNLRLIISIPLTCLKWFRV